AIRLHLSTRGAQAKRVALRRLFRSVARLLEGFLVFRRRDGPVGQQRCAVERARTSNRPLGISHARELGGRTSPGGDRAHVQFVVWQVSSRNALVARRAFPSV